ncbi:MAG: family 20 glycosylhydrolase [Archangium sp.]
MTRLVGLALLLVTACAPAPVQTWDTVLPVPEETFVDSASGVHTFDPRSNIGVSRVELLPMAELLATELRARTGWEWPVSTASSATIRLEALELGPNALARNEAYSLRVSRGGVTISAPTFSGIFYGTQTLLQLLPAYDTPGSFALLTGELHDGPRFPWRGLMVDLARHFFSVAELKKLIDVMARYKLNRLHLHLTDDQGWRLELQTRPTLTTIGASTAVGGGQGGFLTRNDYTELVDYAAARFIVVVPEIDLPGHTTAALASLPELNCDGVSPAPYTGTMVGFSSLCASRPETFTFIDDVIGEVASLTPGPWIHLGGDEAQQTTLDDYRAMINRARTAIEANGKHVIGWEELARAGADSNTIVQHWVNPALAKQAADQGALILLSPARRLYFDMQYALDTPKDVGTFWAGFVSVSHSYDWEPVDLLEGVPESSIVGVEGAAWTEFIDSDAELESMIFPRLLGVAELGWSRPASRDLKDYLRRLSSQGPRLTRSQVEFFRAREVSWPGMQAD